MVLCWCMAIDWRRLGESSSTPPVITHRTAALVRSSALLIEDEKAQVGQARLFCADAICSAASLILDLQRRIANLDRPLQLKQRL